jgi:hypothetical protein
MSGSLLAQCRAAAAEIAGAGGDLTAEKQNTKG